MLVDAIVREMLCSIVPFNKRRMSDETVTFSLMPWYIFNRLHYLFPWTYFCAYDLAAGSAYWTLSYCHPPE